MKVEKALEYAVVAVAIASASSLFAANQYWVGGASGYWGDANWASAAGETGAAWTDGNRAWFTTSTSPYTIDLNGSSPKVIDFYTTGFSKDNRCAINIMNTSETPSTLTFTSLNRNADDELGWADLSFSNVAVVDTSNWGFEIFSGTHITFGNGSTYTKPTTNSCGHVYIGDFLERTTTLEIATGGTFTAGDGLYIGCPGKDHVGKALTGVLLVSGGTVNVPKGNIFMGRCNSTGTFKASNNKTYDNINRGTEATSIFEISGGMVNAKNIYMGSIWASGQTYNQKSEILVKSGGVLKLTGNLYAREYGANSITADGGTIEVNGIEPYYTANGCYRAKNYSVTVKNGGVLALKSIYFNTLKDYTENVHFDNGTFRACSSFTTHEYASYESKNSSSTLFTVGQGGMTIDTQEYTLTWRTRIAASEGKVTKTGSGKLNLNWTTYNAGGFDVDEGTLSFGGTDTEISYGTLTVKSGATLEKQTGNNPAQLAPSVVFKDGAKLNIPYSNGKVGAVSANAITVEGGLEVAFSARPAAGAYPLLTILGDGTFDANVLKGITLPNDTTFAGATLSLSADAKSVVLILSSDPVWIGGADGDLGVASNWSTDKVPQAGDNAVITAAAAVTLVNSASFKATSITFSAGCPKITIEGAPLEGMVAITNLSSANHEFKVPVKADALTIHNTTTYCVFTGGLEADSVKFGVAENTKAAIYGDWRIKGDWQPVTGNALHEGASMTVEGALINPDNLSINSGCVVTAATLNATGPCGHLSYRSHGRLVITGACNIETSTDCYLVREDANTGSTIEFGSLYANTPGKWTYASAKNIIVGADGITCATRVQCFSGPALYSRFGGFSVTGTSNFGCNDSGLTIHTTQYETESTPATIVFDIPVVDSSDKNKGWIDVKGCGTVLFNSESTFSNGLTVSSGTVAVNPGKRPGNSTVTVRNGAMLQVAQSGTVALNGGLTLDDGAALGFNYTSTQSAPVLDVTGKTVTVNGNGNILVKVSAAADCKRPRNDAKTLTAGGKFAGAVVSLAPGAPTWAKSVSVNDDGDIVLGLKPSGFSVIVR